MLDEYMRTVVPDSWAKKLRSAWAINTSHAGNATLISMHMRQAIVLIYHSTMVEAPTFGGITNFKSKLPNGLKRRNGERGRSGATLRELDIMHFPFILQKIVWLGVEL
jgi:hypothetical protein